MILQLIRRWIMNRNRRIFRYWDGTKMRSADPSVVYRILDGHKTFDWEVHPIEANPPDDHPKIGTKSILKAREITADAVREAFGIPIFKNGRGLTEIELYNLLANFVEWMSRLKKNTSANPILPGHTESEFSDQRSTASNVDSASG